MNILRPTVGSYDCPTMIRRAWRGTRSSLYILDLFIDYVTRTMTGELRWR
jgi:hypothetical protein